MAQRIIASLVGLFNIIRSVDDGTVTCSSSFECAGETWQTENPNTITCSGYYSCTEGSLTADDTELYCSGSYSCFGATKLAQGVMSCSGLQSCASVECIIFPLINIYCHGEQSCYNSVIRFRDDDYASITCGGTRSCANATMYNTTEVYLLGYLSGANTTFKTSNTHQNSSFYFYGTLSGYNSKIICGIGHKCNILCIDDACNNLYVGCEVNGNYSRNNSCTIDIDCSKAIYSSICPTGRHRMIDYNVDIMNITMSNSENSFAMCQNALNCKNYNQCSSESINTALNDSSMYKKAICCTASQGCSAAYNITSMIDLDTDSDSNGAPVAIRCDGKKACSDVEHGSGITAANGGNIFLAGYYAAYSSIGVSTTSNYDIFATGRESARDITGIGITGCRDLYCVGYSSCEKSSISEIYNNIYGYGSQVLTTTDISNVAGNVYCANYQACASATIRNVSKLYCTSYRSCKFTKISYVNHVYVNGYDALIGSTIISDNNNNNNMNGNSLIISINGTNTEKYNVYCNESDICKIDCQSSNACSELYLFCSGTCYVNCDKNNGIDCPFIGSYNLWVQTTTTAPTGMPVSPSPVYYTSINTTDTDTNSNNSSNSSYQQQTSETTTTSGDSNTGGNTGTNGSIITTQDHPPDHVTTTTTVQETKHKAMSHQIISFGNTIRFIDENTIYFGLILFISASIMIVVSFLSSWCKYGNDNNTYTNGIGEPSLSIGDRSGDGDGDGDGDRRHKTTEEKIYVPDKAQHFILFRISITLYDLFSDVSYAMYLYYLVIFYDYLNNNSFFNLSLVLFIVYILSLLLTYCSNIYVLIQLFAFEFQHRKNKNEFASWFEKYGSRNMLLKIILFFSILNIELFEILSSKLFSYPLFFAPLSFKTVQYLKKSMIFTVLFENLPQLLTQFVVIATGINDNSLIEFNIIVASSMIVSVVDIVLLFVNYFIWKFARPTKYTNENSTSGQLEHYTRL